MTGRIVLATNNAHKIDELKELLPKTWQVESLAEAGCATDWVESGSTFVANAQIKVDAVAQQLGEHKAYILADDSGLSVDALGGAPGVHSSRYAGEQASDDDNVEKLLREMQDHAQRTARFTCCLVLRHLNGSSAVFEGTCEGEIARERRGSNGFGYDPVFWLPERQKMLAELTAEEKNQISHRARAMRKLLSVLA